MLEGGRITYKQMILLVFTSRIILPVTYLPVLLTPPANQDVWINVLLAFPGDLILAIPIYQLSKRFPSQTLYEYCQTIAGKAGQGVAILYVLFSLHFTAMSITLFSEFFTSTTMTETPFLFFVITMSLLSAYAVRHGIEVLGRLSELAAPLIMIGLLLIVLFLAKDMDLKALTPVLEKGIFPTLYGGLAASAIMVEIVGMAMIFPFLNDQKKKKKVLVISILVITFYFLIITLSVLTVYGAELGKRFTFPFYSSVRIVNVGDFLERIESILIAFWIFGMFIKASFSYYMTVLGISQIFHLKDYKPLVLPTGTIVVALTTILGTNFVDLREFISYKIFTWYSLFFIVFLPFLLLMAAIIRKRGERPR